MAPSTKEKKPGKEPGFFSFDSLLFLLLDRQIVNVEVAVKATGEQLQLGFGVRSGMALGALGNRPVTGVAHRTVHLSVLARSPLPFTKDLVVTSAAGLRIILFPEADLKRFMNGVASHASGKRLPLEVRLVAFGTIRDIPVLVMMATGARLLGMHAGGCLQLLCRAAVAIGADVFHLGNRRRKGGCVGIGVAVETRGLFFPMRQRMAHGAFGHDLRVVVPQRIVCMKNLVAVLAFEFMPPAAVAQIRKMFRMALPALDGGKRLRGDGVKIRFCRGCTLVLCKGDRRDGPRQQNQKGCCNPLRAKQLSMADHHCTFPSCLVPRFAGTMMVTQEVREWRPEASHVRNAT